MRVVHVLALVSTARALMHYEFNGLTSDGIVEGGATLDSGDELTLTVWSPPWPMLPSGPSNATAHGVLSVFGTQVSGAPPSVQLSMNGGSGIPISQFMSTFSMPVELASVSGVSQNFTVTNLGGPTTIMLTLSAFCTQMGNIVDSKLCTPTSQDNNNVCLYSWPLHQNASSSPETYQYAVNCQCETAYSSLSCKLPNGQPSPVCCTNGRTPTLSQLLPCPGYQSCYVCQC
jgi:hypothetical protein